MMAGAKNRAAPAEEKRPAIRPLTGGDGRAAQLPRHGPQPADRRPPGKRRPPGSKGRQAIVTASSKRKQRESTAIANGTSGLRDLSIATNQKRDLSAELGNCIGLFELGQVRGCFGAIRVSC